MWCIISLMTSNKKCHFRKPINHNENRVFSCPSSWQSKHKVHLYISPRMRRNRQRSIQTVRLNLWLSLFARCTSATDPFHISFHMRPMEVILHHFKCFSNAKVTHQTSTLSFPYKQVSNRTVRHTQEIIKEKKSILPIVVSWTKLFTRLVNFLRIRIGFIQVFKLFET